jgi:hypothetical protein
MSSHEAKNAFHAAQVQGVNAQDYINKLRNKPGTDLDEVRAIEALALAIQNLAIGLKAITK